MQVNLANEKSKLERISSSEPSVSIERKSTLCGACPSFNRSLRETVLTSKNCVALAHLFLLRNSKKDPFTPAGKKLRRCAVCAETALVSTVQLLFLARASW